MTEDGGLSVAGWRVWYGNGSVLTSLDMEWDAAPAADVQMVTVYFDRTYRIWVDDRWENQNYVRELHSADYYWRTPAGEFGCGTAEEVPPDLPSGAVKAGREMSYQAWRELYSYASEQRTAP